MTANSLGEYQILEQLGEGGMGAVFRARHERLGREVALKVLRPGTVSNPEHQARFQREMTLAAGLSHPNLVKILDGGSIDGTAFIAMELVSGLTLTSAVTRWAPLPWSVALSIGSRIADGLAFLHEREILHRDVKPSNVLLSNEGYVKLLDFGLARGHGATVMTQEGAVVGTLQFLSPELLTGEDATPGSDLWAVGCILYLMLTGQMHVMATEFNDWVSCIVNNPIPPPGQLVPTLPPAASQLVARLLSRDPGQRPATAAVLRDELDRILWHTGQTGWDRVLAPGLIEALDHGAYLDPVAGQVRTEAMAPPTPVRGVADPQTNAGLRAATPQGAQRVAGSQRLPRPRSSSGGPATRPHSKGAVASALEPPRRSSALLVAAPVLFVAGLAVAFLLRSPAPRAPERQPVASAQATAAPPEPMSEAEARTKSAYASKLRSYLARLKNPLSGKAAVEELRKIAPLDFGREPDNWVHWIELEKWLEDGGQGRPPRYSDAVKGLMSGIEERISIGWINQIGKGMTPRLITSSLHGIGGAPDDGRCWLSMGRVFEMEGRPHAALICYRYGLDRLAGLDAGDFIAIMWTAIARALMVVPGRELERDWFSFLPLGNCRRAWIALSEVLEKDPGRYERVLRAGFSLPLPQEVMHSLFAEAITAADANGPRARALWFDTVAALPAGVMTSVAMNWLCERGELAPLRELVRRTKVDFYLPIADYLGGDPERATLAWRPLPAGNTSRNLLLRLDAFRLLELGKVSDAQTLVDMVTQEGKTNLRDTLSLQLELVGQGTTAAWVEAEVTQALAHDPPDIWLWNDAIGALAHPGSSRVMEKQFAAPGAAPRTVESWRELMRALWLARRGRHGESLAVLERARDAYGGDVMPPVEVTEVLARPLLEQRLGASIPADVVERARAFPVPGSLAGTMVDTYLAALRRGDMQTAADAVSRQFELTPSQQFWGVAMTWHARLSGDAAALATARTRLTAAVRWRTCGLWAIEAARK